MNLHTAGHRRGVVAAPHAAAVEDGRAILAEGGNAIEAMIAMAASIAAVYPHMNHIGGDGFWLIREPSGRVRAIMGAARAHDGAHAAGRFADQPEAVAADMVHVRIDRGDRGGHREHRLDGVAAFGEDDAAVLDRGGMRRTDDAAAMSGAVESHGVRLSML